MGEGGYDGAASELVIGKGDGLDLVLQSGQRSGWNEQLNARVE
jgi:hypothetical protein